MYRQITCKYISGQEGGIASRPHIAQMAYTLSLREH